VAEKTWPALLCRTKMTVETGIHLNQKNNSEIFHELSSTAAPPCTGRFRQLSWLWL
jgi:hypothetical protein